MEQLNSMIDYDKNVKEIMEATKFNLSSIIHQISQQHKWSWVNTLIINLIINIFKEIAIPQLAGEKKSEEVKGFIGVLQLFEADYIRSFPTLFDLMINYLELINSKLPSSKHYGEVINDYRNFVLWIKEHEGYFSKKSDNVDRDDNRIIKTL